MKIISENPVILLFAWYVLMSAVLFFVMGRDKRLAKTGQYRVPEARLFLLALIGGALGGVLGMRAFRHKTKHLQFVLGFPILALLQWGLGIWLLLASKGGEWRLF